ncbi:hypothetical protein BCR39DRAFT_510934 [Naematelia encephala]|uniref:Uncharacterized protein n=1 Tax=Naematelia encephala TaxID=71784 RepID=A0A1Y2BLJ1_9TREE|nr:hypothetical protein BCR39DRAFT_510934 [Naematelia encephala]
MYARHMELSSVDAEISSVRNTIASVNQSISQDNFQIALLQITAGNQMPTSTAPMTEALKRQVSSKEKEVKGLEQRLADEVLRRKGIQDQPPLLLPAAAVTPLTLPAPARRAQKDPEPLVTAITVATPPAVSSSTAEGSGSTPPSKSTTTSKASSTKSASASSTPTRRGFKPDMRCAGPPGTSKRVRLERSASRSKAAPNATNIADKESGLSHS